jgi:hypothetical protein
MTREKDTKMELGIPYGRQEVVDGGLVTVCPQCGERISEPTDSTGEITEDRYGAHYVKQHARWVNEMTEIRRDDTGAVIGTLASAYSPVNWGTDGEPCCPTAHPCSVHDDVCDCPDCYRAVYGHYPPR